MQPLSFRNRGGLADGRSPKKAGPKICVKQVESSLGGEEDRGTSFFASEGGEREVRVSAKGSTRMSDNYSRTPMASRAAVTPGGGELICRYGLADMILCRFCWCDFVCCCECDAVCCDSWLSCNLRASFHLSLHLSVFHPLHLCDISCCTADAKQLGQSISRLLDLLNLISIFHNGCRVGELGDLTGLDSWMI